MWMQLVRALFCWPFDTDKRCSLCRKETRLTSLCWLFESISSAVCPDLMGVPHERGIHAYKYCDDCINRHYHTHMAADLGIDRKKFEAKIASLSIKTSR